MKKLIGFVSLAFACFSELTHAEMGLALVAASPDPREKMAITELYRFSRTSMKLDRLDRYFAEEGGDFLDLTLATEDMHSACTCSGRARIPTLA